MAEEMLQVGDIHPAREQPGGHRMPQQVGIDALGNPGRPCHRAHDLADALTGQGVRHRARALLAAGEERPGPAGADVQPEQLSQLAADRHLAPLTALAVANDHDALGKADVLDPQLDQLGGPQAGFEQGLQHQPGSAVAGISLIEKAQLFLHSETVHAAAARRRRLQPGPLSGGFEDRLALGVIQALADEDGGDSGGGTREGGHDPVCFISFGVQTDYGRHPRIGRNR